MEETRYLTFALGKGRLANKTLELLEEIGITCEEMIRVPENWCLSMKKENLGSFWQRGRMYPPMWSTERRISVW